MRFLATGDLQIHKWQQFAYTTKSGMNSRLANCLKVLKFIREKALERGISKVLLNGDILEECDFIDVETFNGVYNELEKSQDAGIETVINLGNHDVHGEFGGRIQHALRAFRKVATVVEEPIKIWGYLFVVPWMSSPDLIKTAIGDLEISKNDSLALHYGVQGAVTGPKNYLVRNPIHLKDIRSKEFALTLLSDYHTSQRLQRNPPVWYLGSPIQHTFGEIHKPCVWEIFLRGDGGKPKLTRHFTNFPQFRRVSASSEHELERRTSAFSGDYVKVFSKSERLSDRAIERVASRIGFRVQVERMAEAIEDIQNTQSVNFQDAMCSYVWNNVKTKSRGEKLLKLGWRIFNGEY
jgi:DNA repair exonuclease SbcCD nuclease subunit